jgi:hypothetical protein
MHRKRVMMQVELNGNSKLGSARRRCNGRLCDSEAFKPTRAASAKASASQGAAYAQ